MDQIIQYIKNNIWIVILIVIAIILILIFKKYINFWMEMEE